MLLLTCLNMRLWHNDHLVKRFAKVFHYLCGTVAMVDEKTIVFVLDLYCRGEVAFEFNAGRNHNESGNHKEYRYSFDW